MRAPAVASGALALLVPALPSGERAGGGWPAPEGPAVRTVEIREMRFRPARLDVAPGDSVVWVNRDVVPHTATASNGAWDSGTLGRGERWTLVVEEGGSIEFVCRFHPTMRGRLDMVERRRGKGGDG